MINNSTNDDDIEDIYDEIQEEIQGNTNGGIIISYFEKKYVHNSSKISKDNEKNIRPHATWCFFEKNNVINATDTPIERSYMKV
jgi:hypothetical protein